MARWSEPVKNDGTHRYAHTTLPTPLADRGAYLVYAYAAEPPKELADKAGTDLLGLGDSRQVMALTDVGTANRPADGR